MGHVVAHDQVADDHEERMARTMEILIGIALFALAALGLIVWGAYRFGRALFAGYVS